MRRKMKATLGLSGLLVAGLTLAATVPAGADYAPQPGDIVGVGGDTAQFALEFAADGDYLGDAGFNSAGAYNRLVTFNATADANGRSAYANGSTEASPIPLNPTVVLRAGTYPVQRVSSSGAAINALLADTSSPEVINFIWSSSEPTSANQTTASHNGWGYLHVVEIGTDKIEIASDSTSTNVPAGGLSIAELLGIYTGEYTTWNQLPGNSGGSSATIIPLIPPSGSSIYKTFIAQLTAANGGTAPTLAGDVETVEQNDPTAITGLTGGASANAIVPFSLARYNLYEAGYFHSPSTAFPGSSTPLNPGIQLYPSTDTATDGNAAWNDGITDYVIFRQSDATSTSPMEPGGSRNWVETLFSNPGGSKPFFDTPLGESLVAAAGVTPNYVDLGDVSSG